MFNLDFLSEPPQLFFFKKETNKTTFGGFLFIIFIIIILIITIFHILEFSLNNKYEISYSIITNTDEEKEKSKDYPELDPLLNLSVSIKKLNILKSEESNQFTIYDMNQNYKIIKPNTIIQMRPSEMLFAISYECTSGSTCTLNDENGYDFGYIFEIKYQGYKLNHQGSIPLTKDSNIYFSECYPFSSHKKILYISSWEVVKYIDNKGTVGFFDKILNKNNEYISGKIKTIYSINNDAPLNMNNQNVVLFVALFNNYDQYIEYQRQEKDILNVIANIGSLFSTCFSVFIFIFAFYSKNINNYQIMNKIMSKNILIDSREEKKEADKENFETDLINQNKVNNCRLHNVKSSRFSHNNSNVDSDLQRVNKQSQDIMRINNKSEIKNNKEKEENRELKKLSFRHIFLNSFFLKCCNEPNVNQIIDLCNDILSKYTSIELLLYNQIMLENLLEDYIWNNPDLKDVNNNKFLSQLYKIS